MLSPNARNVVFCSCGMAVTITEKLQLAFSARASVASHVIVVNPFGNWVPDAGVQVTRPGGVPCIPIGASNDTVGACPLWPVTAISAGQFRIGPPTIVVGPPPQWIAATADASTIARSTAGLN